MNELDFAIDTAIQAGRILLDEEKLDLEIKIKNDKSYSTRADKASSRFIVSQLKKNFHEYGIIEEESSVYDKSTYYKRSWVVDPLDSTISYIKGLDTFGVLIGLLEDYKPILGVAYLPVRKELYYAEKGNGAFLRYNGKKTQLKVRNSSDIDLVISEYRYDSKLEEMLKSLNSRTVRKMPSSFKTLEVAKGISTLFLSPTFIPLNLWDLCATQLILEESGGKLTDLYGKPIDYKGGFINTKGVLASNGFIHDDVVQIISRILSA
jgi:3'(2'), 5'-bisphosphate nucleotidase